MIYVAEIQSGIVVRVIVANGDYVPTEGQAIIGPENVVGIGWSYEADQFVPPPVEAEPEE